MGASKLSTTVERWLESHARRHGWLSIAGSAASLLGGIVVLYITYWFVTMLMWMVFDWLVPTPTAKATATWIVLGLLFVGYFTANWQHLENLEFESRGRLFTARLAGLAAGSSFLNLAAGPKTAHSFVKVISATLLLGPGLVVTSWRLLVRAKRLFLLDTAACAKPIAAVLKAGRKVPLEDLAVVGDDATLEVRMAHRGGALAVLVDPAAPADELLADCRPHLSVSGVAELLTLYLGDRAA